MWKTIPGGVQNERGVAVRPVSYRYFEYRDGDRVLMLAWDAARIENGRQILEVVVPAKWEPPHDSEAITFSTRQAIISDLEGALKAMGFIPEVSDLFGEIVN